MTSAAAPLDDVRDISKLAYGFMASKALFVALDIDLFGSLSGRRKDACGTCRRNRHCGSASAYAAHGLRERRPSFQVRRPLRECTGFAGISRPYRAEVFRRLLSLPDRPADLPSLRAALRSAARQAHAILRQDAGGRGSGLFQPRATLRLDGTGRRDEPACGPQGPTKTA